MFQRFDLAHLSAHVLSGGLVALPFIPTQLRLEIDQALQLLLACWKAIPQTGTGACDGRARGG